MSMHKQTNQPRVIPMPPQQPVGGFLIDAQGREIAITEYMIQRACSELEKNWVSPNKHS
jgi:hypothetical protein